VSTWAHNLISGLPELDFWILSIVGNPHVRLRYKLPPNVKDMTVKPLWGTELTEEYDRVSLGESLRKRLRTTAHVTAREFAPHFKALMEQVSVGAVEPAKVALSLVGIYDFFQRYDYKKALRSKIVWETFLNEVGDDDFYCNISVLDLIETCRILGHFLLVLTYVPKDIDIVHSASASLAAIPAILLKVKFGRPFLLTEHGVYYRERLLDFVGYRNAAHRILWINIARAISRTAYYYADKITSVCSFNIRWQKELLPPLDKIEVVYNGVDPQRFRPIPRPGKRTEETCIVMIGRVNRLKGPLNLIEAMSHVAKSYPAVKCKIYGEVDDEDYYAACQRRVRELGLEGIISFEGVTDRPEEAILEADVVAVPSIAEGFPYAVVESMACAKPIVGSDVGGLREAVGDAGILVPSASPVRLAKALLMVLEDEALRRTLSARARQRVEKYFAYNRFIADYRRIYTELLTGSVEAAGSLNGLQHF